MAYGKSAELAKITRSKGESLCTCGGIYSSHFDEEGNLMEEFKGHERKGMSPQGLSRAERRKRGWYKKPTRTGTLGPRG